MSFKVKAIMPRGVMFEKEAFEAYFPSVNGPIGIFTDYAPGIIALKEAGVIRIRDKDGDSFYAIFGGVVKIEDNNVVILSDIIEDGFSIDMARAIAARDRAQDRLSNRDPLIDQKRAQAALFRAMIRIQTYQLSNGAHK